MISTIARTDKSTLQHDEGLTQCQFNEGLANFPPPEIYIYKKNSN